jgi:hypothetical protein
MSAQAYPLQWPAGLPRAKSRAVSAFGEKTIGVATRFVLGEVRRMNGSLPVLSTNLALRGDGLPYANQRQPADPGAALYFQRRGKPMVFACDRWLKIEHNIYAIGKTIEALRGIERWGSSDMMERAFVGFQALPAPKPWWEVLGLDGPNATRSEIAIAYRRASNEAHPDRPGGSHDAMAAVNAARDEGLARFGV